MPDNQNIAVDISTVTSNPESPRKKTMTEAALAANRANAKKSTGPRTTVGKLRAASNALQHGLYSLRNFEHFIHDHDFALEVVTNFTQQFQPLTPAEHALTHHLIHMELRFLQMEHLYNQAMNTSIPDLLANPPAFLNQILRELDRLPARIQRTLKSLHAEQARRLAHAATPLENFEIEPIADQEPLPALANTQETETQTEPQQYPYIDPKELFRIFAGRIVARCEAEGIPIDGLDSDESNPSDSTDPADPAPTPDSD